LRARSGHRGTPLTRHHDYGVDDVINIIGGVAEATQPAATSVHNEPPPAVTAAETRQTALSWGYTVVYGIPPVAWSRARVLGGFERCGLRNTRLQVKFMTLGASSTKVAIVPRAVIEESTTSTALL
jgi:hypothetical protein